MAKASAVEELIEELKARISADEKANKPFSVSVEYYENAERFVVSDNNK